MDKRYTMAQLLGPHPFIDDERRTLAGMVALELAEILHITNAKMAELTVDDAKVLVAILDYRLTKLRKEYEGREAPVHSVGVEVLELEGFIHNLNRSIEQIINGKEL